MFTAEKWSALPNRHDYSSNDRHVELQELESAFGPHGGRDSGREHATGVE